MQIGALSGCDHTNTLLVRLLIGRDYDGRTKINLMDGIPNELSNRSTVVSCRFNS